MSEIFGYNIKEYDETCVVRSTGHTTIRCPTPEHVDNNPSCDFNVYSGGWRCISCGATGSLSDFERHTGIVLEKAKLYVDKNIVHSYDKTIEKLPLAVNDAYVLNRIDEKTIIAFGIRSDDEMVYIPTSWGHVVRDKHFPDNGGRKYYYYGDLAPYYTLNKLEYNKPLFVVEGIFGLLKLYELGYNSLCVFGTNNTYSFLKREMRKLQNFTKVRTMFDNDMAGRKATSIAYKYYNIMQYIYDGDIDNIETINNI